MLVTSSTHVKALSLINLHLPVGQSELQTRASAVQPAQHSKGGFKGMGLLSRAAMAAISDAWDYVVDEAAVAEAAPQLATAKPVIDVAINANLAGICFVLAHSCHQAC